MTLKIFLKENMVLVVGLSLPLLLIVFFFMATVIPKSMATPPKYEMLFTLMKYDYQNSPDYWLNYNVKDKHLLVKAKKNDDEDKTYNLNTLMAYDANTDTVREINIDAAKTGEVAKNIETLLEETKTYVIDQSMISPDGYKLVGPNYGGGGLFGGTHGDNDYRIQKGSVAYKLPDVEQAYFYNQVKFIGWVIKK